ncbi:MAG: hypothetical protein U1F65_08900 [Verrucomicrobiota bacterium]
MKTPFAKAPMLAAVISVAALVLPVWVLAHAGDAGFAPVRFLFSGAAFAERPFVIGGALDQFSLHKEVFILCLSLLVLSPSIVFVRWLNRHRASGGRWLFAAGSLMLLLHPLSVLTIFTYDVARYFLQMGFTPMRLAGLVLALLAYVALAWFALWICGFSRHTRVREQDFSPTSPTSTKQKA